MKCSASSEVFESGSQFDGRCATAERGGLTNSVSTNKVLSIIVLYDHPFDAESLDQSLFSLAVQDYTALDIIVVMPNMGGDHHRAVETLVRGQPWPKDARARTISVSTKARKEISGDLLKAGITNATGRYVSFIHHQDLVYQHAYRMLIARLECCSIAFGGVRVATHRYGARHWAVTGKKGLGQYAGGTGFVTDGRAAIHAFVADRAQLDPNDFTVHHPSSCLAAAVFFARLALHPRADFTLTGTRMVESRTPPSPTSESDLGRLPSMDQMLMALAGRTGR